MVCFYFNRWTNQGSNLLTPRNKGIQKPLFKQTLRSPKSVRIVSFCRTLLLHKHTISPKMALSRSGWLYSTTVAYFLFYCCLFKNYTKRPQNQTSLFFCQPWLVEFVQNSNHWSLFVPLLSQCRLPENIF